MPFELHLYKHPPTINLNSCKPIPKIHFFPSPVRSRGGSTPPPSWSLHPGLPLHAHCISLGGTVPTQSDPEVLVGEEHGEKQEVMAEFSLGTLILKPQTLIKCTLGSSFVKKTSALVEKNPLQLLPTASFMGWHEVRLSLRRVHRPLSEGCKVQLLPLLKEWGPGTLHAQPCALPAADGMLWSCS